MGKDHLKSGFAGKSSSNFHIPGAGKVGVLDEQTIGYYRRISETLKGEFGSQEEKDLFINNVFTQLSQEALKVSQNQTVSCIVEDLISLAGRDHLTSLLRVFSADFELACCDRFASFVTQSIILHSSQFLCQKSDVPAITEEKSLEDLFDELITFLTSQLALNMQHTYASHILRVVLEVLAGCKVSDMIVRSRLSRDRTKVTPQQERATLKQPPAASIEKLFQICSSVADLKKLDDHVRNNLSSPVLQAVLLTSSKTLDVERHESICRRVLTNADIFKTIAGQDLPENVVHEIGSHLIEQFLITTDDGTFNSVLTSHLNGKLLAMAKHPIANFVLQKLIANIRSAEQFVAVFDELSLNLELILALNHLGVIQRVAEACVKFGVKQKKFIKSLCKAFHCYKPAERQCKLVPLVASLTTYEAYHGINDDEDKDEPSTAPDDENMIETEIKVPTLTEINYHGSLILQNLLRFGNPKPIVNGLMELKVTELRTLCMNACGSHVIDAFVTSETVGEKCRDQLCNKLKGHYLDLACDKTGSRTFDSLWKVASMKHKCLIAEELLKHEDKLKGSKFGFFVHSRCALRNYKQRPEEWKEIQSGLAKKRKQFLEIIDEPIKKKSKESKKQR